MSQDFETNDPATPQPPSPAKAPEPRPKNPAPPKPPHDGHEKGSTHHRRSTMAVINSLLLLVLIGMLGFVIYRQENSPLAGGKTPEAKPEDSKAVNSDVDRLKTEIAGLTKKLGETTAPADPTPQIKSLDEKVADLYKSLAETPARLESLNQKVETAVKSEAFATAPKVDVIDKKMTELIQAIDSLKASLASHPASATASSSTTTAAPSAAPAEAASENSSMAQAVDLFKKGKFLEAKEAFARLELATPDDARVWYYSALANGLATRDWKGESERLVNIGVEKEKAGKPDRATIDAAFADLTTNSGKDWLAFFRSKAAQ